MILETKQKTPQQCEQAININLQKWGTSTCNNTRLLYEIIGLKMKQIRLSHGWSQTEVAKMLNVTFQQIQKYEKATNFIPFYRLLLFCEFTKSGINEFLTYFTSRSLNVNATLIKGETHEQTNASA